MAYILGFWWADGCITGWNVFKIAQHKNDEYILSDMLKRMNTNYKVLNDRNMRYINIVSDTIVEDIKKLGGKERKSLDVKFPKVPKKYLPSFIRGLWDGDGCISIYKNGDISCVLTSGSKCLIAKTLKILSHNIRNFKGRMTQKKNKGRSQIYYCIVMGANDARRLRDYMYRHKGLCLKRKYDKFVKIGDYNIATYDRKYMSYDDASEYVKKLELKNWQEWFSYSKGGKRPFNLPSNPWKIYRNKGWVNCKKFIGQ